MGHLCLCSLCRMVFRSQLQTSSFCWTHFFCLLFLCLLGSFSWRSEWPLWNLACTLTLTLLSNDHRLMPWVLSQRHYRNFQVIVIIITCCWILCSVIIAANSADAFYGVDFMLPCVSRPFDWDSSVAYLWWPRWSGFILSWADHDGGHWYEQLGLSPCYASCSAGLSLWAAPLHPVYGWYDLDVFWPLGVWVHQFVDSISAVLDMPPIWHIGLLKMLTIVTRVQAWVMGYLQIGWG